jgi:hypothetical protein
MAGVRQSLSDANGTGNRTRAVLIVLEPTFRMTAICQRDEGTSGSTEIVEDPGDRVDPGMVRAASGDGLLGSHAFACNRP